MVMPFAGPEEALRALELLQRDPAARDVSVIVIDLRDAVIDEAFGALALEQIWAAPAGARRSRRIRPLSRGDRRPLQQPLLVAKSLEEGVRPSRSPARSAP
jgi:hypothetical protein